MIAKPLIAQVYIYQKYHGSKKRRKERRENDPHQDLDAKVLKRKGNEDTRLCTSEKDMSNWKPVNYVAEVGSRVGGWGEHW